MEIIDLQTATTKDLVSTGYVLINNPPALRKGKRNEYMVGQFTDKNGQVEFKVWEAHIYAPILAHGNGIYQATVQGSEFNGVYLTVQKIQPVYDDSVKISDFLPRIPTDYLLSFWRKTLGKLSELGVSHNCFQTVKTLLAAPELEQRFMVEGAAMRHHDNKLGGLAHHTTKMLNILAAILENNPPLKASADLLAFSIIVHDIGKVWEYNNLSEGEYWYVNHRVRGVEFLAKYKDLIVESFDETFYRQVQAVIAGHHGEYADRPQTVAAAIVHFIDNLESQVTGLVEDMQMPHSNERIRYIEWGYLKDLELSDDNDE